MKEEAFRAFLRAAGYTDKSVASRMARARSVERLLRVDLDTLDLSEAAIPELRDRLGTGGSRDGVLANELNAVRTYRRFRSGEQQSADTPPACRTSVATHASVPRSTFVTDAPVATLLALYGEILDELRDRGVTRTANAPVGDYGEWLFAKAFGWALAGGSTAGYDALDEASGERIQVKARRLGRNGSRQLGVFRDLDDGFDLLAAVLFDPDLTVSRAALIPVAVVRQVARRVDHVNGWRVMLPDSLWQVAGVEDVTERLRAAAG